MLGALQSPAATGAQPAAPPRPVPFEVNVNGSKAGPWVLLEHQGQLYAPLDALVQWRIQPPTRRPPLQYRRAEFHALDDIDGYTSRVDFANQALNLTFDPGVFQETRLGAQAQKWPERAPGLHALILNYDLNHQWVDSPGDAANASTGVVADALWASPWGAFTSSFLGNIRTGSAGEPSQLQRLETTFSHDFAASQYSLQLGDTSTRVGMLGGGLYFGGVRFGTDFSLTPGFVSQPLPVASGASGAPSTLELYVNDVLRQTTQVPAGPFTLENLPATSGVGDIRIVVRDIFGREQVITRSIFTSASLLAPGLSDWSVEAGRVRRNLGASNSSYGPAFARGYLRRGITPHFTLETVAEASAHNRHLQLGVVHPVGGWLGTAALGSSHTREAGGGLKWQASLERMGLHYGVSLNGSGASPGYRTLFNDAVATRRQWAASFSYASAQMGQFGLGLTSTRTFEAQRVNTLSLQYAIRIGSRGTLNLHLSRSQGTQRRGQAAGATLVLPLQRGPVRVVSVSGRGSGLDATTSVSKNPQPGDTVGWRVVVGRTQGLDRAEAGVAHMGQRARLTADLSHTSDGSHALRASASGALVFTQGKAFALSESGESLAWVEVPGYPGVRVGRDSQGTLRTDRDGHALVPGLQAFQENSIVLNPQDLPISAELDSIEQLTTPGRQSVVRVRFPVRSGRGALLRVVLEDGQLPSLGASVRILGEERDFVVGRRGEVFVTGLQTHNRLQMRHAGGVCHFSATLPPASDHSIARVGPLTCTRSSP